MHGMLASNWCRGLAYLVNGEQQESKGRSRGTLLRSRHHLAAGLLGKDKGTIE